MLLPAVREPGRMIQNRQSALVKGLGSGNLMTLPDACPQDAIDKPLEFFRQAHDFQGIHRFVDGRRFRYPVEEKNLVKADGQGLVYKGMKFFQRLPAEEPEAVIKVLALTENPVNKVHSQMPVLADKSAFFRQFLEKKRNRQRVSLQPAQGLDGSKPGGFTG